MSAPKVSVILPVYNVEPYIGHCIETLQAQTMRELEFIFVDDCSTDDSMEAVEAWAAEDSRVRTIYKEENQGAGPTRNRGIEEARGAYLSFVDPDDYVSPDFYELLYAAATAGGGHDIAKGRIIRIDDSGVESSERSDRQDKRIKAGIAQGRPLQYSFEGDHQAAIYKHELFENDQVRYGKTRHLQDVTFLLFICSQTQDIVFEKRAAYYYMSRDGSAVTHFTTTRFESEIDALTECYEYMASRGPLTGDDYRYLGGKLGFRYQNYRNAMASSIELAAYHPVFVERVLAFIDSVPEPNRLVQSSEVLSVFFKHLPLFTPGMRNPGEGEVRVSVILPVYNVEPYIGRCIESLKLQILDGLEFIFVDDCSCDGSMEAVKAWAAEDERVRIIYNEENLGAGPTRNRGIEEARGDYISFVDPDDYVSSDFYLLLYAAAVADGGHDIAKGVRKRIGVDGTRPSANSKRLNKVIRKVRRRLMPLFAAFAHEHQAAIYSRSLFEGGVRYGTARKNQDSTFLPSACLQSKDTVFEVSAVYYYANREG